LQRKCACGGTLGQAGECEECRKKRLQHKTLVPELGSRKDSFAPPIVHEVLRSPGQPLDLDTRAFMEPRFGHDFSQVRVHTNANAAESARAVNALAYTVGRDVVFGAGQYAPITYAGRQLIAHELTHTIQQTRRGASSLSVSQLEIGEASSPEERESDAIANAVVSDPLNTQSAGRNAQPATLTTGLQRKVSPQLAQIEHLLRSRGFFEKNISAADTHQVLLMFKAMSDEDLRDTVRAMEASSKEYLERFLTHIDESDQLKELETLRRVKNARVWKTEAKTGSGTVATEVVGSCSPEQFQAVYQAGNTALSWLGKAVVQIDAFLAAPGAPGNYDIAAALDQHFHSKSGAVVGHIREQLAHIRADIASARQFTIECHGVWDRECAESSAYTETRAGRIVFCNSFFSNDAQWQAGAIIHEMAHAQVGSADITDRAYRPDRMLRFLSTEEALTNAESFALLAQQLAMGKPMRTTAPKDKPEDCPDDWWKLLEKATAMAQRWNRNLQVTLEGLKPEAIPPPHKWATYLSGGTQANINKAKTATDNVAAKLKSAITLECEPGGGGRCDSGVTTYWYFTGNLHVCPAWKAQGKEETRVQSLLAGLYGYAGDVDDNTRRNNYAQLAQENNESWATPMLASILGGSQWKPEYIHIEVTPRQPKGNKYYYSVDGDSQSRMSDDTPTAQIPEPEPMLLESNLRFETHFLVDYSGDQGRPLPFTAPAVRAEFHFASPAEKLDRVYEDLRPVYRGAGAPLVTKFPQDFEFSIRNSGSARLYLELKDPDARVTRIYDDTIQLQVMPQPGGATP
jgi:hypothetical protein